MDPNQLHMGIMDGCSAWKLNYPRKKRFFFIIGCGWHQSSITFSNDLVHFLSIIYLKSLIHLKMPVRSTANVIYNTTAMVPALETSVWTCRIWKLWALGNMNLTPANYQSSSRRSSLLWSMESSSCCSSCQISVFEQSENLNEIVWKRESKWREELEQLKYL